MSFFFGTILEKQVLLAGDRMNYDGHDKTTIGPSKIHKINNSIFPVWGGNLFAGNEILKIIRDLCLGSIKLWELEGNRGRDISKLALSFWKEKVLKDPEAITEYKDKGRLLSLNILLGGLDSEDHPFLGNLFDAGNFEIQFYKRPGISVISPNTPEIIEWVRGKMREFLTVAMGESEEKQRELAKQMLPGIIGYVSQHDKFVSSAGDLFFIHGGGSELFTFGVGRWRGVMERISLYLQSISERLEERKRLDWEKWQRRKGDLTEQRKKRQERWQAGIDRLFNRFFGV